MDMSYVEAMGTRGNLVEKCSSLVSNSDFGNGTFFFEEKYRELMAMGLY
jgi:hypothetical protein